MKQYLLLLVAATFLACTPQDAGTDAGSGPTTPISKLAATGEICGTIAGITCASDKDYCKMAVGECRIPDMSGTCTVKPQMCTRDYRPVCGCDGKTYSNGCTAASAGINILHDGECATAE